MGGCTPRSLEINPFLSAILLAYWKDICVVDPSVIDSRSPCRHITTHTYETSIPTLGNTTTTVLVNTSLYRRHQSLFFCIHPASLQVTESMMWLRHSLTIYDQQCNTGEKPTVVMLYIYYSHINCHAGTPDKNKTKTILVHNKIGL